MKLFDQVDIAFARLALAARPIVTARPGKSCSPIVIVLAIVLASCIHAGAQSDQNSVVGVWELVEYHDWEPDGGENLTIGPEAEGVFIYSPDGNLSLHIMTGNERPVIDSETSDAELGRIYHPYIGYYGAYSVDYDAMTITHHIEGSKSPNRIGGSAKRPIRFEDGDLILDFGNDAGWRFYRRLRRVEKL